MRELGAVTVTGGAEFIGSEIIWQFFRKTDTTVINVETLTHAGNLKYLAAEAKSPRYTLEHADIRNKTEMERISQQYKSDVLVHLAAESHVDRLSASGI